VDGLVNLVDAHEIRKVYKRGEVEVNALKRVSLTVKRKEFVAITGPSGSGKSTLMNILGCLDTPTGGKYILDGEDVSCLSKNQAAKIRNKKIGFVFQGFNLLPRFDALTNVELPLIYSGMIGKAKTRKAKEALELVGLGDRMRHLPSQLSGGQIQRVAIARAIVNEPEMALADEPTGNLDSRTSAAVLELFRELNRKKGVTFILVTHDPMIASEADRVTMLTDGEMTGEQPT
jgi:putative ABC transport system ATP-binding protein